MNNEIFTDRMRGAEVHLRLVSNDLLEDGKHSITVVGTAFGADGIQGAVLHRREYTEYEPETLFVKFLSVLSNKSAAIKADPNIYVVVEEKSGSLSADDARYIEWLGKSKGRRPTVVMVPESAKHPKDPAQPRHLLGDDAPSGFWARQWRRLRALPAPITKDAAIAAIPRTAIPVGFSIFLAYLKRHEIPLERAAAYVGLAFGFAVGFALLNQTVLNWFTFWSEFTRESCDPYIGALERWIARQGAFLHARLVRGARFLMSFLAFVSARGDVLIAGPLLGIVCSYLARLVLGAVGETVSVLTLKGFLLVLANVVMGSLASGPYPQVIAHLRSVGKISNRASMYLGILDTVRMELGRVADFGMQTLYNVVQGALAVVFWTLLLLVDRWYLKPEVRRLAHKGDIEFARRLFTEFRSGQAALV